MMKMRLMIALCAVAFAVAALRYLGGIRIPRDLADFAGGLGVGIGIALLVVWAGQRTPRE